MAARFDDSSAFTDRYHIEREVGSGGMARVFLARDLKHDRDVAIKVLRPELSSGIGKERFLREIKLAARLMHPHILPLFDSGEDDGALYFVMPYVKGASLRVRLAREGQLPLEDALEITRDIAGALDYAHRQDIVHRDIKPENIMIHDGVAMVTDFGIGKALRAAGAEALTQAGALLGTPAYMSPEQVAGETTLDGRSDIYSLGCVLYEMLTGQPPFTGESIEAIIAKRLTEAVPSLDSTRETIPNDIRQTVHTALAKKPDDRFATGAEFADALAPPTRGDHPVGRRSSRALRAIHRGAPLHQHECGPGERILQRRDHRRDHQCTHPVGGPPRGGPYFFLRVQRQDAQNRGGRHHAQSGDRARRQCAESGFSTADHGAVGQRRRRVPNVVRAVRSGNG